MIAHKILILTILIFISSISVSLSSEDEIVFAISPMASPASTLANYSEFIEYLSRKTGTKIILKQRKKYAEINSLLKSGEAEFALTCTGAYLSGRDEFGLEILEIGRAHV